MLRYALSHAVEGLCLVLMTALSVDLMLGVFSRYVLVRTFTWYDEVARGCFVWVVFLGAALGVKRGAHFRLHLLVDRLSPSLRQAIALLGLFAVVAFAAVLMQQGWALVELGTLQQTPVMGISKAWIYAAIPVGGSLMSLYTLPGILRLLRRARE